MGFVLVRRSAFFGLKRTTFTRALNDYKVCCNMPWLPNTNTPEPKCFIGQLQSTHAPLITTMLIDFVNKVSRFPARLMKNVLWPALYFTWEIFTLLFVIIHRRKPPWRRVCPSAGASIFPSN